MSQKMKLTTRILSIFLSIILLFEVIPMQAFAEDLSTNDILTESAEEETSVEEAESTDEAGSENESGSTEPAPAQILAEDVDKREESVKHFRMSDGTIQAAQYAVPVHFAQNGVWTDYDNTLTEVDADEEENDGKILKNKDLTNQAADYSVRLSKKTNGHKFVRLEKDGYKISWYYLNANKSTAQIAETEDDGDPTTLEKLSSAVVYENVYKATDFEYILNSQGVKENLLLQSTKAPTEFTAEYKAGGLTPVAIDTQTVELRASDGTAVYTLSAPYMEDATGEISTDVTLTLGEIKNDTFRVTLTLDSTWLQAEERVFPVTVDPYLTTSQEWNDVTNCQSAYIASSTPGACYGRGGGSYEGSIYVGKTDGRGKTCGLIKTPNLPTLGIADKVVRAEMAVFVTACYPELRIDLHRITTNWEQNTVCWNSGVGFDGTILDYQIVQTMERDDTSADRWQRFEITDLVRGWYSGDIPNYGVFLRSDAENSSSQARAWILSSGYTTVSGVRPVLTVHYRNMSGYEDQWSFTNITAGRDGLVSVNNFNGNLVFSQPVTESAGGNRMPVNLSLIFNSNKGDAPYSIPGSRMQTNFHMFIVKEDANGDLAKNGYKYYLNDADGTKHWFYFEENVTTEGKDEDGLGLKLNVNFVGTSEEYVITDKDDTKMYFDTSGRLTKILNADGNSATVTYEQAYGTTRISSIKDGAGRSYTFRYLSSAYPNHIEYIVDPAGRETHLSYYLGTVVGITFADGEQVLPFYNYNDYTLTEIRGIDGTRTKISYDSSAQKRVTQINWGASDSNLLEKYTFAYKQNSTTVTDVLQDRSYTYQFDDFGRMTGIVSDTDGSAQFYKWAQPTSVTDSRANKLTQESQILQTVTNYIVNPGFTRAYSDGYVNYIENTANQSISIDASHKNITNSALKIYKAASNTGRVNAVQFVNGLAAGTYTFSAYVNTDGATLAGNALMFAEVWNETNQWIVHSAFAENTRVTNGWERKSVTFDVPAGCHVRLIIGFAANGSGTVWYDDLQLEKGEGESTFNLVENSGFTNGTAQWSSNTTKTASINLSGLPNCGYTNGDPEDRWKGISQPMLVSGKANEVFSFGAWIKAASAPIDNGTKNGDAYQPAFNLALHYYNANGTWAGCKNIKVNEDLKNQWQFVSGEIIIPQDFYKICIEVIYFNNVNTVSVTGAFCFKEQYGQTYDYDKDGNVVSTVDLAKTNSTFAYYGNQMAKMLNPSGSKYLYNYNDKKQLYKALSSDGQEYGFSYDDKGNVTKAEIVARKPATSIESGKKYILVNSYSGLAMDSHWDTAQPVTTYHYSPSSTQQHWLVELVSGTTDVYTLKSVHYGNRYLDVKGGGNGQGTALQTYAYNGGNAQKFKIVKKQNNTFALFTACSNYTKVLDGQLDKGNEIVQSQTVKQANCNPDNLPEGMRWYFYPVEATEDKTIVTETTYTANGNFAATSKDQRGNTTAYQYDETKGTLKKTIDALNRETNYTYNENNNKLETVSSGGMTNTYTYEKDRLQTIDVNGALQYTFDYDAFGRTIATKVGNGSTWRTLSSIEYAPNGQIAKRIYGNEDYIEFKYDDLDRIIEKKYNGSSNGVKIAYNTQGQTFAIKDTENNRYTKFTYDLAGRTVRSATYPTAAMNGNFVTDIRYGYESKTNRLANFTYRMPRHGSTTGEYRTADFELIYGTGADVDRVTALQMHHVNRIEFAYDGFGRVTGRTYSNTSGATRRVTTYTYQDVGTDKTTTLLKSVNNSGFGELGYEYDAVGNITQITKNGAVQETYTYDNLNQLKTVTRNGITTEYNYQNGNITSVTQNGTVIKTYGYTDSTWSDLLTSFNGQTITYDEIGNPLQYRDGMSFTWAKGRQLQSITKDGLNASYTYDENGLRISKTVNGITTKIFRTNGQMVGMNSSDGKDITFILDGDGNVYGVHYDHYSSNQPKSETYYFAYNAQGDVIGIYEFSGRLMATYDYDEWGNCTVNVLAADNNGHAVDSPDHIAYANPFRYRGYFYDAETGFYYLNSRYYDPGTGRFVNADGYVQTGQGMLDKNMFAYCLNNPVMREDADGDLSIGFIIALAIIGIGTIVGGVLGGMSSESLLDKSTNAKNEEVNDTYLPKPPVLNNNSSDKSGKNSSNNNPRSSNRELSRSDRVKNIAIGATLGMATGGAVVAVTGIVIGGLPVLGASWALCTTGAQMFMTGALAFNLEAMVIGPFFSIDLEPIEWEVREER